MTIAIDPHGMNISACSFTPASGTLIPITGVKTATYNENPEMLTDGADMDYYDSFGGVISGKPSVAIELNRPFILSGVNSGTFGTLTYTVNSFLNKSASGGGAMTYTFTNCFYAAGAMVNGHRVFGTKSATFYGLSLDGITNPMAVSAV